MPNEKPPLLSGRDTQALDYLKNADETNALEEEIPRNMQSLPPLGKLTKKMCYMTTQTYISQAEEILLQYTPQRVEFAWQRWTG